MKSKRIKIWLVVFALVSGGLSIYFFIDAIVSKPKDVIKVDRIQVPEVAEPQDEELFNNQIPDEVYEQIQSYKRHMDSLGQPIRPGLLDSMRTLEEMYLSQQK